MATYINRWDVSSSLLHLLDRGVYVYGFSQGLVTTLRVERSSVMLALAPKCVCLLPCAVYQRGVVTS